MGDGGNGKKQKALEQWQRNGTGADEMRALCERCEALLADATRLAASDTAPQRQAPQQQQSALEAEVQALREKVAHYERGEDYDPQAVREMLGLHPIREFEVWAEKLGILHNGRLGEKAGDLTIFGQGGTQ